MQTVKAQPVLAPAFVQALAETPALRGECGVVLQQAAVNDLACVAGDGADGPVVMWGLDCLVLPSLAEGVSETILKPMASGLLVIATSVGPKPVLVLPGLTDVLVHPVRPEGLVTAVTRLATNPSQAATMGLEGSERVLERYSLAALVDACEAVYQDAVSRQVKS